MKHSFTMSRPKGQEVLDLLIEFVYLAIIFVIPLYFSWLFPTNNIFELSKSVIFQAAVLILLFLSLIKLIYFTPTNLLAWLKTIEGRRSLRKYLIIPIVFIGGLALTLLFSTNLAQSFFGSYERQAGYLSFFFYFVWFILLLFNILTVDNRLNRGVNNNGIEAKVKRILSIAVISGFFVSIYGILQIFGVDFLQWPEEPSITGRALSTFGQPNFLASWLVMVIPLTAYLIYDSRQSLVKFFYTLALMAQLFCLFFTGSRGGLLAFVLNIFLLLFYFFFSAKIRNIYKAFIAVGLLALVVAGLFGLNNFLPGRISGITHLKEGSMAARVNFYQAAADAISKKPIFGYGLENAGQEFIKYYTPDWGIYGDVGATTDRAHNLVLDILMSVGFFGLALFSILFFYFFQLAQENIKRRGASFLPLALLGGAFAYLVSLLFSFTIVAAEVYFWLFIALTVVINFKGRAGADFKWTPVKNAARAHALKLFSLIVILGAVLGGLHYQYNVIIADYYFNKLYYILPQNQYFTALTLAGYIQEAKGSPVNQESYNIFIADKLSDFYPSINDRSSQGAVQDKLEELKTTLDAGYYVNDVVEGKINFALGDDQAAETYFQKVIALTPYWPKPYLELGKVYARQKKWGDALVSYGVAAKILPAIDDPRLNTSHKAVLNLYRKVIYTAMGDIDFGLKNYAEAEEYYQLAYLSDVNDYSLLKKIADTYYYRGDLPRALIYNLQGTKRNPSDFRWFLSSAVIYRDMGDKSAAKKYYEEALKLEPAEKFLIDLKEEF